MAVFQPNKTIAQKESLIQVEVSADKPLPLGLNRFQLIVVDDSNNVSVAATIDVMIKDTTAPTAGLSVVNADGKKIDPVIPFGQSFFLSGAQSTDAGGGKIVEYRFTLLAT
jgi:hypothetical protein